MKAGFVKELPFGNFFLTELGPTGRRGHPRLGALFLVEITRVLDVVIKVMDV